MKIYVAAAYGEAREADFQAEMLAKQGAQIVSTWHRPNNARRPEPTDRPRRQEHLMQCFEEVDEADTVYFLFTPRHQPRCALVEVGYALAKDKKVIFWDPHCIADSHPNSTVETNHRGEGKYTVTQPAFDTETSKMRPGTPILPVDSDSRKETPIFSGVLAYFPLAIAAVARHSKRGNDKHNPGQPLHWARVKSMDQEDCIARHLVDVNTLSESGEYEEATALAWRALAKLQLLEESRLGKPPSPGSR